MCYDSAASSSRATCFALLLCSSSSSTVFLMRELVLNIGNDSSLRAAHIGYYCGSCRLSSYVAM